MVINYNLPTHNTLTGMSQLALLSLQQVEGQPLFSVLFESIKAGRTSLSRLTAYHALSKEGEITREWLDPALLPDYCELKQGDMRLPLSRFSFDYNTPIQIEWQLVPAMIGSETKGIVSGSTRIDAMVLDNTEVQEYITRREQKWQQAYRVLSPFYDRVERQMHFSQDGEAICAYDRDGKWVFIAHLDPFFVYDSPDDDTGLLEWLRPK